MRKIEADVLIVGSGAAGMAAAITAAEQGATVAVFEKMDTPGGCSNMAAGPFGVESTLQKRSIISLSKEEAVQKFMNYTHWRCDERLVREYVYLSGNTIDWLTEMGVRFIAPMHYFPGSEQTWHFIGTKDGQIARSSGAIMIQCMVERAKELDVEIYLNTPVLRLNRVGSDVVGLVAKDQDGEFEASGGTVIICSGGFGDNPDMIQDATGLEWGKELYSIRVPGVNGEGIKMAWEVGANSSKLGMDLAYFMPNTMGYETVEIPFRQCDLLVNLHGERFMDETQMQNPIYTVNSILLQPKCESWSIADDAQIDRYIKNGANYYMINGVMYDWGHCREEINEWLKNRPDVIVEANSIEELAQKTGINAAELEKTIESYNEFSITGDEIFHKDKKYIHAIKGPKYYAMKFAPSSYSSVGGIRINHKAEALDKNSDVIPGLYAAGTDANALYDPDYVFVLPGNMLGFALNTGRIAGNNAISYIKTKFAE